MEENAPTLIENQPCPVCKSNTLTLTEAERDVPYFGLLHIYSMDCSSCNYHKADVEADEKHEPCRYELEVNGEEALKTRVVKSSTATVKIPRIMTISPGIASNGYITNIEGLVNRVRNALETARDNAETPEAKAKAKSMLKKINRVLWGSEKITVIIEDPSGNSAIISEKAKKSRLKV